jgi:hypothetical protein
METICNLLLPSTKNNLYLSQLALPEFGIVYNVHCATGISILHFVVSSSHVAAISETRQKTLLNFLM